MNKVGQSFCWKGIFYLFVGCFLPSVLCADGVQDDNAGCWTDDYNAIPPGDGRIDVDEEVGFVHNGVTEQMCDGSGNGSYVIKKIQPINADGWSNICFTIDDPIPPTTSTLQLDIRVWTNFFEFDPTVVATLGNTEATVDGNQLCFDLSGLGLEGLRPDEGGIRITVRNTSGARVCVDRAQAKFHSITDLLVDKTFTPDPIRAGEGFTTVIRFSVNKVFGEDVVVYDTLPSCADGTVLNGAADNTTATTVNGTVVSNATEFGQCDQPAPLDVRVLDNASDGRAANGDPVAPEWCGTGGVADGADGTVDGFCTIDGTPVPLNSIFWRFGDLPEGTTQIVTFEQESPNGTVNGTVYRNVSGVNARNRQTGTMPTPISYTNDGTIVSEPNPRVDKYFPPGETFLLGNTDYVNHGDDLTTCIRYRNGLTGTGDERLYCPYLFDDLSDIYTNDVDGAGLDTSFNDGVTGFMGLHLDGNLSLDPADAGTAGIVLPPGATYTLSCAAPGPPRPGGGNWGGCDNAGVGQTLTITNTTGYPAILWDLARLRGNCVVQPAIGWHGTHCYTVRASADAANVQGTLFENTVHFGSARTDPVTDSVGFGLPPFPCADLTPGFKRPRTRHPHNCLPYNRPTTYTLEAANNTPFDLSGIYVFDSLPTNLTFLSAVIAEGATNGVQVFYATNAPGNSDNPPGFDETTHTLSNDVWSTTVPADPADVTWVAMCVPQINSTLSGGFRRARVNLNLRTPPEPVDCCATTRVDPNRQSMFVSNIFDVVRGENRFDCGGIRSTESPGFCVRNPRPEFDIRRGCSPSVTVLPGMASVTFEVGNVGNVAFTNTIVTARWSAVSVSGMPVYPIYAGHTVTPSGGTILQYDPGNGLMVLELGPINPGEERHLTMNFTFPDGLQEDAQYTVELDGIGWSTCSACPVEFRSQVSCDITGFPLLRVRKNDVQNLISSGDCVDYSISAENIGAFPSHQTWVVDRMPNNMVFSGCAQNPTGNDVWFSDAVPPTLPLGFSVAEPFDPSTIACCFAPGVESPPGSGCWVPPPGMATQAVTYIAWRIDDPGDNEFDPGSEITVSWSACNDDDGPGPSTNGSPPGTVIYNTTVIFSEENIQAFGNQVRTTIIDAPALEYEKTGPDIVVPGELFEWVIEYRNVGSEQITNVVIRDFLPPEVELVDICHQTLEPDGTRIGGRSNLVAGTHYQVVDSTSLTFYVTHDMGTPAGITPIYTPEPNPLPLNRAGQFIIKVRAPTNAVPGQVLLNEMEIDYDEFCCLPDEHPVEVKYPDLYIVKIADNPQPLNGDIVTYYIQILNAGDGIATNVVLVDMLPPGLAFVPGPNSPSPLSPAGYSLGAPTNTVGAGGTNILTWSVDLGNALTSPLGPGIIPGNSGPIYFSYQVQVVDHALATRTRANYFCISNDVPELPDLPNDDDAPVTIPDPDLEIQKTASRIVEAGSIFQYTITWYNSTPAPAPHVYILEELPPNVIFSSHLPDPSVTQVWYSSTCMPYSPTNAADNIANGWTTAMPPADQIRCIAYQIGTIPGFGSGYSTLLDVIASDPDTGLPLPESTEMTNTINIVTPKDPTNMVEVVTETPGRDIRIIKTGDPEGPFPGITPGGTITYTLLIENSGVLDVCGITVTDLWPAVVSQDIGFADLVDVELTDAAGNPVAWHDLLETDVATLPTATYAAGPPPTWTFPADFCMPAGSRFTMTLGGTIDPDLPDSTIIENTAIVDIDGPEKYKPNNTNDTRTTVYRADVTVAKAVVSLRRCIPGVFGPPASPPSTPPNTVAYLNFNAGDLADTSGSATTHNGSTPNGGGSTFAEGGACFAADNASLVELTNHADLNTSGSGYNQKSLALWFRPDTLPTRQWIYKQGGGTHGFGMYLEGGILYAGAWRDSGNAAGESSWAIVPGAAAIGEWTHVALVYAAGTVTVYVNGNPTVAGSTVTAGGGTIPSHGGNVSIGGADGNTRREDANQSQEDFDGCIDEYYNINGTLAQADIDALLGPPPATCPEPPVTSEDFADQGDKLRYTINYNNIGNFDAENTVLCDTFPVGTKFVEGSFSNLPPGAVVTFNAPTPAEATGFCIDLGVLPAPPNTDGESTTNNFSGSHYGTTILPIDGAILNFTPADISPGIELWLDAADSGTIASDANGVSQWDDKSGNDNHATQASNPNKPATGTRSLNGLNVLDITADKWMQFSTINMVGKEVWSVFQIDDTMKDFFVLGHSGNTQFSFNTGSQAMRLWKNGASYSPSGATSQTLYQDTPYFNAWRVLMNKTFSVNGVNDVTGDILNTTTFPVSRIARSQYPHSHNSDGLIGEIIIVPELTTSQRQQMEGYLAHKWGLADNLPEDHPYKVVTTTPCSYSGDGAIGLDSSPPSTEVNITVSAIAPVVDGHDIGVLTTPGTDTDKTWSDTANHGQSFTTGANPLGYELRSFTVQTSSQAPATKTWDIRIGEISGTTFTPISYLTDYEQTAGMNANDYLTFNFDPAVQLEPNKTYGVDFEMTASTTPWQDGIPYLYYHRADLVAGGDRYTRVDGNPTTITPSIGWDRVFHADLEIVAPGIAGTYTTSIEACPDLLAWDRLFVAEQITDGDITYSLVDPNTSAILLGPTPSDNGVIDISSISPAITNLQLVVDMIYTGDNFQCDSVLLESWTASYECDEIPTFSYCLEVCDPLDHGIFELVNNITIGTDTPEITTDNNADSDQIAVRITDLKIDKSVDQAAILEGETVTWTLMVENDGPQPATNVTITEHFPTGMFSGPDNITVAAPRPVTGPVIEGTTGSGLLLTTSNTWTTPVLFPGEILTITFQGTAHSAPPTAGNVVNNRAETHTSRADADWDNNVDRAQTYIGTLANMAVTKSVNGDPDKAFVLAGDEFVWTICYTNNGNGIATNATLIDHLPSGVVFVAASVMPNSNMMGSDGVTTLRWDTAIQDLGSPDFGLSPGSGGCIVVTSMVTVATAIDSGMNPSCYTNQAIVDTTSTEFKGDNENSAVVDVGLEPNTISGLVQYDETPPYDLDVGPDGFPIRSLPPPGYAAAFPFEFDVVLMGCGLGPVTTRTVNGEWNFTGLDPCTAVDGGYTVTLLPEAGYESVTNAFVGGTWTYNMGTGQFEQQSVDGVSSPIDVNGVPTESGDNSEGHVFFVRGFSAVTGIAWFDSNSNGMREALEPRLEGIEVTLYQDCGSPGESVVGVTTTGIDGAYGFTNVTLGASYCVEWDLSTIVNAETNVTVKDVGPDDVDSDSSQADPFRADPILINSCKAEAFDVGIAALRTVITEGGLACELDVADCICSNGPAVFSLSLANTNALTVIQNISIDFELYDDCDTNLTTSLNPGETIDLICTTTVNTVTERVFISFSTDTDPTLVTKTGELIWAYAADPTMTCPSALDFGCPPATMPPVATNLAMFVAQRGSVLSECPVDVLLWESTTNRPGCGDMIIERVYAITNACGVTAACTQVITTIEAGGLLTNATYITCPAPTTDLGCVYATNIFPLLATADPLVACPDAILSYSDVWSLVDCTYSVRRDWTIRDRCSTSITHLATNCTQTYLFVIDREPPKVVCPPGRSLGCIPEGVAVTNFVAAAAPVAIDLDAVTVVEGCTNCEPQLCLWCDTYTTNGCVITLERKFRATDCCGNVGMCSIIYTMNDTPPEITGVETGGYLGCQSNGWIPPTNLTAFTHSCPYNTDITNLPASLYCEGPVLWFQEGGTDADGLPGGGTTFVNRFDESTPAETILSHGEISCAGGERLDYVVRHGGLAQADAASGANNNAFTIHNNQADWFTSIDQQRAGAFAELSIEFFELGSFDPLTQIGVPSEFGMSVVSLNSQPRRPNGTLVGNANRIGRLHSVEEYHVQHNHLCGARATVTTSDPFDQLFENLSPIPGFDYRFKWEKPGFGNDLDNDNQLDVDETDFSMNLPNSSSYVIRRENMAGPGDSGGLRSGIGFGGAIGTASPDIDFDIPPCQTNITERLYTNDVSCEVTVVRTYTVSGCCDQVVSRDIVFTYTRLPDLEVGPLAKLDLGCIASTNQVPPVDVTMVMATSDCAIVSIRKLSVSTPTLVTDCNWSNQRAFVIETLCGVTRTVTQSVCWVLNNTQPEIISVLPHEDFGCVDSGDPRPVAISLAGLEVTNAISTALVSEVRQRIGCDVLVTRTWRVDDCCGNFDRREETYQYTPSGDLLSRATVTPTVEVGCVTSPRTYPCHAGCHPARHRSYFLLPSDRTLLRRTHHAPLRSQP